MTVVGRESSGQVATMMAGGGGRWIRCKWKKRELFIYLFSSNLLRHAT